MKIYINLNSKYSFVHKSHTTTVEYFENLNTKTEIL